jgi:hypothetical protein
LWTDYKRENCFASDRCSPYVEGMEKRAITFFKKAAKQLVTITLRLRYKTNADGSASGSTLLEN